MSAAKLIRFAVLVSLAGAFAWVFYLRGGWLWLLPAAAFAAFALFSLRR
jgi:hypothetical protein